MTEAGVTSEGMRRPREPLGQPGPTWRGDGALGGAPARIARNEAPRPLEGPMGALGLAVAPFHLRAAAFLVDYALLTVVLAIVLALSGVHFTGSPQEIMARAQDIMPIYTIAEVLLRWPWNAIGVSPGKRLVGLRIVDIRGQRPGPLRGLARSFAALVSELLPLGPGYLWAAWDRERRTWHDHLAGTWVVRVPREERRQAP